MTRIKAPAIRFSRTMPTRTRSENRSLRPARSRLTENRCHIAVWQMVGSFIAFLLPPDFAASHGLLVTPASAVEPDSNLIRDENRKPGATDWQLTRVRADRPGFRSPWIEGYCSRQSAKAGETIDI